MGTRITMLLPVVLASFAGGCTYISGPTDSSPMPTADVKVQIERMRADPVGLERPLVIIDGWTPIGGNIERDLRSMTGADDSNSYMYSYMPFSTLDTNSKYLIQQVEKRWPSDDPQWTTEVDVVGYSMGGIIARVAALPSRNDTPRKQLKIHTMYTISTPHRGTAGLISVLAVDEMSWSVSNYGKKKCMGQLDEALADAPYRLICYGQGNDWIVGGNTAPPGYAAIEAGSVVFFSHTSSCNNRRHLADIAARLRGDPPLAPDPPPPELALDG